MPIRVNFGGVRSSSEKPLAPSTPAVSEETAEKSNTAPSKAFTLLRQREKPATASNNDQDSLARQRVEEVIQELDSLVGLTSVKQLVGELRAFVEIQRRRARENLVTEPLVLHMIFKGNPGTGKTTVARILGKLFKEMGILAKGHLVEVERADLVGEYIGHTAQKTRDQIKKALGGVLFIDEAYSLARGGEKDFGKEAIDAMVKAMEDYKNNLVLILAGYKDEMDWFLQVNPGLRSRFPILINFPDYAVQELMEIAHRMLQHRQYRFSGEAQMELERILRKYTLFGHQHCGNARLVRNLIERAIRRQAVRLVDKKNVTREELMGIAKEDIQDDMIPSAVTFSPVKLDAAN